VNIVKLVKMVNQIAINLDSGDHDVAVAGTVDHLSRFWSPEMKKQIIAHLDDRSTGLNPIAEAAVRELASNKKYAA